jgi:hypothetical protein
VHESLPNKYPGPELHQPDLACSAACTLKTVRCLFTLGTSPLSPPEGTNPALVPTRAGFCRRPPKSRTGARRCRPRATSRHGAGREMTVREEIVFSIFFAAALVMGWRLIAHALDYVLG